jgi:hypothetical protein
MSELKIQTGTPPRAGAYVVWTPCKALQAREWCEPSIATWQGGRWHTYDPPWAWIGPLPVVHGNDCFQMSPVEDWAKPGDKLEYDL